MLQTLVDTNPALLYPKTGPTSRTGSEGEFNIKKWDILSKRLLRKD